MSVVDSRKTLTYGFIGPSFYFTNIYKRHYTASHITNDWYPAQPITTHTSTTYKHILTHSYTNT